LETQNEWFIKIARNQTNPDLELIIIVLVKYDLFNNKPCLSMSFGNT